MEQKSKETKCHNWPILSGKPENGLTLIELLVTITLLGLVFSAVVPIFEGQWKAWTQGASQLLLRQDLETATVRISSAVRQAEVAPEVYADTIKLQVNTKDNLFKINGKQLTMQIGSDPEVNLLPSGVELETGSQFAKLGAGENTNVIITLVAKNGEKTMRLDTMVAPRKLGFR